MSGQVSGERLHQASVRNINRYDPISTAQFGDLNGFTL